MYKLLILTFKAFIDRTAPLYLCELIEQQKSSTNNRNRLANDAFLLKLPPPSRNCSDTFFDRSFTYGAPYEWNRLDERVSRLSNFKGGGGGGSTLKSRKIFCKSKSVVN